MINPAEIDLLREALERLAAGFEHLPEFTPDFDEDATANVLQHVARRLHENFPYHHPLYAGQMLKPPHAVARLAYALSLWINPNNHALDGGRASSAMEKECINDIGALYGWDAPLGHLTGGGTMANLEALWVAGQLHPGKRILASEQAHYTHKRISQVLGLPFSPVAVDALGRMDPGALEIQLSEGNVGTIVATMGSTGLGAVDPLDEILELARQFDARVHADAAYGGYFTLAGTLRKPVKKAFKCLRDVNSIVVDPHKHGLQPYGCGCILFRDASVGSFYKHGSPYTYFSSAELHLGEISLECSRPGAAAVALWATLQLFPLERDGQFAIGLEESLSAARGLWRWLDESDGYQPLMKPDLDIVVYAVNAKSSKAASEMAQSAFKRAAKRNLHLALIELPTEFVATYVPDMKVNSKTVTCLRSVLMKAEHLDWLDDITAILDRVARKF